MVSAINDLSISNIALINPDQILTPGVNYLPLDLNIGTVTTLISMLLTNVPLQ